MVQDNDTVVRVDVVSVYPVTIKGEDKRLCIAFPKEAASNDNEAPVRAIESSRWDLQNTISRGAYSSNQMVQSCTSRKGLHEVQIVSANTIPLGEKIDMLQLLRLLRWQLWVIHI
ncbi:hypothetical protein V6N13_138224 [Hibiscus sabdariffa]